MFEIEGREFALARKEKKIGQGHTNFEIETDSQITIEEDLYRRDITINSIAKNVLTGEIVDPFKGQEDIKNKVIKATSKAFVEDPLRTYRVARFASELGFEVEENTINLMRKTKNELNSLSPERIFIELRKALNTSKPSAFFEILKKAEVLDVHFREIYNLIGALQPEEYHPEGDAYNHTMQVIDYAAQITNKEEVIFAALVHDLGKGITPKEEYPHHFHHEINGVPLVYQLGKRLKLSNIWMKCGESACREHMKAGMFWKMAPAKKLNFIEGASRTNLGLEGIEIIAKADKLSNNRNSGDTINFASIGSRCLKEINGKYIAEKYNISEGIEFGRLLRLERIAWIRNISENNKF